MAASYTGRAPPAPRLYFWDLAAIPLQGAFPSRFPLRGAGGERGEAAVGFKESQEPPWEVGNQGAGSGHQTWSCCQFVMFSLKSQRFNGKRGQALT